MVNLEAFINKVIVGCTSRALKVMTLVDRVAKRHFIRMPSNAEALSYKSRDIILQLYKALFRQHYVL